MNKYINKNCVVLMLIFGVIGGTFYPLDQKNIDLNEDGIIDVCDVQQLISAIISDNISLLPDINNDGKIDIKDLQILMKNMGTKQKTAKVKTEIFSSIPKPSFNVQHIKKIGTYNFTQKFNLIKNEENKFTLYLRDYLWKTKGAVNYSCQRFHNKLLAFHISPQSPPII